MSNKSKKKPIKRETPPRRLKSRIVVGLIAAALILVAIVARWFRSPGGDEQTVASNGPIIAREVGYEVVNNFPHDPEAFLQGLVWHNGFFESTGQLGRSSLRRVEYPSGQVLQKVNLDSQYFGEGLAMVDNRLIQLTWQSHLGFVYDRDSFELLGDFRYDTEGWGVTYDGKSLVLSDGTDVLTFINPHSFKPTRKVSVKFNGTALRDLNELEYINGEIWANVWHTDLIVRIDPASGQVKSYLNLAGILPAAEKSDPEAVLNGIAYDAQGKRIFVSGKLWPRIFEIRLK
ncbi:MAG TPA: glutaminyl-peptide cyclotransferase [Blastocatellia bacterium]|nr:glutaminyl-peptide cyclotransferase [Blastocatellia bacterium]